MRISLFNKPKFLHKQRPMLLHLDVRHRVRSETVVRQVVSKTLFSALISTIFFFKILFECRHHSSCRCHGYLNLLKFPWKKFISVEENFSKEIRKILLGKIRKCENSNKDYFPLSNEVSMRIRLFILS